VDIPSRIVILLARVLLGLDTIQTALLKLVEAMDATAIETTPKLIQGTVLNTQLAMQHHTSGLVNAYAQARADTATLLAAIAALPAGSDIVIPAAGNNASAVWDYEVGDWPGMHAREMLGKAGWFAFNVGRGVGLPMGANPFWAIQGEWDSFFMPLAGGYPYGDWSDIREDDTRLSWLERTEDTFTWTATPGTGDIWAIYPAGGGIHTNHIHFLLTEADFQRQKSMYLALTAPIWPGIDKVTLGETVPAVASTTLEFPMHGILWVTTGYPPARARWGAAPYYSVYHTGRLAFITDNGDLEPFQYMGWQNAIFVPQTMGRAAGVVVFLEAGIEGAITPWDISV